MDYEKIMHELVDIENLALATQGLADSLRWEDCINPKARKMELERLLFKMENKVRDNRWKMTRR